MRAPAIRSPGQKRASPPVAAVSIRGLREDDLEGADQIHRAAFAAQLGVPDAFGDRDFLRPRSRRNPGAALAAEVDGELVGSIVVSRWGSFGFPGPMSVRPDCWGWGIGRRLFGAAVDLFDGWGLCRSGLYTFPDSPRHVPVYRSFGYQAQNLAPMMTKTVTQGGGSLAGWRRLSALAPGARRQLMSETLSLTSTALEGLDLRDEIQAVHEQGLGETLVLHDDDGGLGGLVVCHIGAGTEAGSDVCYLKFGFVRPGPRAADRFSSMLSACQALAAGWPVSRLFLGINAARCEAYRAVLQEGFTPGMHFAVMQRPEGPGYNRPGVWVVDDWR